MPSMTSIKQQFIEITGVDRSTATKFLNAHSYNLERALEEYLSRNKEMDKRNLRIPAQLVALYDKYRSADSEDVIDIDGTIRYLEDLHINPDDLKSLTLSYFLGSPRMGTFKRGDFLQNWTEAEVTTIEEMSRFITSFHEATIKDPEEFGKLYNYTFGFLMENENQKLLGFELATEYWKLLLISNIPDSNDNKEAIKLRLEQWNRFIGETYKRNISRDSWNMFYLFYKDIIEKDPEKFSEYDEMSAWPSVIDEFVNYIIENNLLAGHDM